MITKVTNPITQIINSDLKTKITAESICKIWVSQEVKQVIYYAMSLYAMFPT